MHASAGKIEIGAEYMVRSFTDGKDSFFTGDYLVVEVAIFPARGETFAVSGGSFRLRVNGKNEPLFSQSPGMVAASLKYPDWQRRRNLDAELGVGGGTVILGRRQPAERFPGDPRPGQTRLPQPPNAPEDTHGFERPAAARAEDVAVEAALPEGPAAGPVSGYLYFAWRGKPKSIKRLELLYQGPDERVTVLRLI